MRRHACGLEAGPAGTKHGRFWPGSSPNSNSERSTSNRRRRRSKRVPQPGRLVFHVFAALAEWLLSSTPKGVANSSFVRNVIDSGRRARSRIVWRARQIRRRRLSCNLGGLRQHDPGTRQWVNFGKQTRVYSRLASAEDFRHQTAQSTVYREELRELAIANAPEWTGGIRCQKASGLHG
jgi:hypothetical protein